MQTLLVTLNLIRVFERLQHDEAALVQGITYEYLAIGTLKHTGNRARHDKSFGL